MNGGHRKRCRSYNTPGEAHELTFSCFRRLPLLCKDRSRQWFVEALDEAVGGIFLVWAYLIMPEHVHVIVLRASFSGLLLRTPFTGFFAQRLGPPLTAGVEVPIISAAPFTRLPVFWLEPSFLLAFLSCIKADRWPIIPPCFGAPSL